MLNLPVVLGIPLIVFACALTGAAIKPAAFAGRGEDRFDSSFDSFLVGLACLSLLMMVAAILGFFSLPAMLLGMTLAAGGAHLLARRRGAGSIVATGAREAPGWVLVAGVAVALHALAPPFEARLNTSDTAVYLAAADRLAQSGTLVAVEPLVAEMAAEERRTFFAGSLFQHGRAGNYYHRFPGGVQLLDPAQARVSFNFYHLWPAWLALGKATMGSPGLLAVLPLFAAIGFISLYLLGKRLAGRVFGAAAVLLLAFCFPQVYYARMPLSEIPAQALFLSGLYCFLRAMRATGIEARNLQLLAGALWGALCLARLDGALFLFPALGFCFLLGGELRRSVARWAPFAVVLLACSALAVVHQLAVNSYEFPQYLVSRAPLLAANLPAVSLWIMDREPLLVVTWVASAALAVAAACGWADRARRVLVGLSVAMVLVLTAGWLFSFLFVADWTKAWSHLQWLAVYLPLWMVAVLALGWAMLAAAIVMRPSQRTEHAIILVFTAVPLASFLIAPMVTAYQPWAIRRIVPILLPMLLTSGLLGWKLGLATLGRRLGVKLDHAHVVIAVVAAGYFASKSAFLWREPLHENAEAQLQRIASALPKEALVILPDRDAGTQVQLDLQYRQERPTLLLPAGVPIDNREGALTDAYVKRQLAVRPVFALVQESSLVPSALSGGFRLVHAFSEKLSFREIATVGPTQFPGTTRQRSVSYHAFEVKAGTSAAAPASLNVGAPTEDLPYLVRGFHSPEGDPKRPESLYRWTTAEAEMRLPPVRAVRIHARPQWRPPAAPPLVLTLRVNGRVVAYQTKTQGPNTIVEFTVPEPASTGAFSLVIGCEAFTPRGLGLSNDGRELGIPVFRVDLER